MNALVNTVRGMLVEPSHLGPSMVEAF